MIDCESLRKILNNKIDNDKLYGKLKKSVRPQFKKGLEIIIDQESKTTDALREFGYTQFCLSKNDVQSIIRKAKI